MPATVARREILLQIHAIWVGFQHRFDEARFLEKRFPFDDAEDPQRRHGVADRHLICRLPAEFAMADRLRIDEVLPRPFVEAFSGGAVFADRFPNRRSIRIARLLMEAVARTAPQRGHRGVRLFAFRNRGQHLIDEAAKQFDHREPQHDRYRPQFADPKRRRLLIFVDCGTNIALGQRAFAATDDRRRERVDARKPRMGTVRDDRQLAVIRLRHVAANLPHHFVDHIIIIEQPLGFDRHAFAARD